jgi:WD40 repeat protein
LAWSPDSKYLAIGTNTTPFVEFYTVLSSGALLRLGQPTTVASGNCRSLEFVDNDTVVMVAAGLASRSVFRYNLPSFSEDSVILDQLATNTARGALTLSNTHLMVVAPSLLRVYDLAAGTFISFAYTNPSPSYIVRVPNTNKFLIGAGTNASFPEVEYFEYTGSAIVKLTGGVELAGESVRGIDIHPKGDQIVITTNFNGLVTLYDADFSTSAPVVTQIAALTPNTNSPEAAFSPDGRSLWIQTSTTHGFYKSSQRISTQNKIPRLIRDYRP